MNRDIAKIAKWAQSQGWRVSDDTKGYTRFFDPTGAYVAHYPATPSRPARRMADLVTKLNRAGLPSPPPSKNEQRSEKRGE